MSQLLETRRDVSRLNLSKQMDVADGTLGRIKYGSGNPNVETLAQIARFFKFEPWQLLVPGFTVNDPPALRAEDGGNGALAGEEAELVAIFRRLKEPERTYLLANARGYAASVGVTPPVAPVKSPGAKVA
ncbi:hypothetical protein [Achromobacter xylosoxidans]|uniref:hypothetical protein n=1 Tax=Alcaligenes xylosoxydans xylosoxydans TaxID=85698 RepID=UPI001EEAF775|nr:hypothetical protein [Achromobacter xylosoxidans]